MLPSGLSAGSIPILFDSDGGESPPPRWRSLHSDLLNIAVPAPQGETIDFIPKSQNEAAPEEENIAKGEPGSVLEVKYLDETYDMVTGQWSLKVTPQTTAQPSAKEGKYDAYAFTVIRKFQPVGMPRGGHRSGSYNVITQLEIHSEHLRQIGQEVIGHVQGISWNAKPLRVCAMIMM